MKTEKEGIQLLKIGVIPNQKQTNSYTILYLRVLMLLAFRKNYYWT